ncbi:hypothetical protein BH11BAC4_BH11BAC4_08150 [soil metagenome]
MTIDKPYGLIMCGGNSSRMGIDKSKLVYHSKPQCYYLYEMMQSICEKVFISCNEEQSTRIKPEYELIIDLPAYKNIGPLAGLLSAFTRFPKRHFLITGCDYPYLNVDEMIRFILSMEGNDRPAAFYNNAEHIYEPLLGHYPYTLFEPLKKMFTAKQYSLQSILCKIEAGKYLPSNEKSSCSVDTYEDYLKVKRRFIDEG